MANPKQCKYSVVPYPDDGIQCNCLLKESNTRAKDYHWSYTGGKYTCDMYHKPCPKFTQK